MNVNNANPNQAKKIQRFCKNLKIGDMVLVITPKEEKIEGQLSEIAEDGISICTETGGERFQGWDHITSWQGLGKQIPFLNSVPESNNSLNVTPSIDTVIANEQLREVQPNGTELNQGPIPSITEQISSIVPDSELVTKQINHIYQTAKMLFQSDSDLIAIPEPSFDINSEELEQISDKKLITNLKSRYKDIYFNAIKVKELSRLSSIISELKKYIEIFPTCGKLFQLCAILMLHLKDKDIDKIAEYLYRAIDICGSNSTTLQAISYVEMKKKNWEKAAENIALLLDATDVNKWNIENLRALGGCFINYPDIVLNGLCDLYNKIPQDELYKQYDSFMKNILFLALKNKSQEAAIAIFEGKIQVAKAILPEHSIFKPISLLYSVPEIIKDSLIAKPKLANKEISDGRSYGIVTFYPEPERRYGFVENLNQNETYFFTHEDGVEEELWQVLMKGISKVPVTFVGTSIRKTVDAKYTIAQNLEFCSENDRTKYLLEAGITPKTEDIPIKAPIKVRKAALPKTGTIYARAKFAEQEVNSKSLGQYEDFEEVIALYKKAIAWGLRDKTKEACSAVMDLASLYSRFEHADDALNLFRETEGTLFSHEDSDRIANMKISILTKAKRYEETLVILDSVLKRVRQLSKNTPRSNPRYPILLQQKAFCYLMLAIREKNKEYLLNNTVDIIKELKNIRSHQGQSALAAVKDMPAKYDEAMCEEIPDEETLLTHMGAGIIGLKFSNVVEYMLENDNLENLDQNTKELFNTNQLNENKVNREIARLKEMIDSSTGNRPEFKKGIFLNIATLCQYANRANYGKENELITSLYKALFYSGVGCIYSNNLIMAKVYLCEALQFCYNYKIKILSEAVSGFLLLSYFKSIESDKLVHQRNVLDYSLSLLELDKNTLNNLLEDFPYLMVISPDIMKPLFQRIITMPKINNAFMQDEQIAEIIDEEKCKIKDISTKLKVITSAEYVSCQELNGYISPLSSQIGSLHFQIDRNRLIDIIRIVQNLVKIDDYSEYNIVCLHLNQMEIELKDLRNDIECNPTNYSLEYFKNIMDKIDNLRNKYLEMRKKKATPQLHVRNVLENDNYIVAERNGKGYVRIDLEVSLPMGSAPIHALEVNVLEKDGLKFDKDTGIFYKKQLNGGQSQSISFDVIPSQEQINRDAFDVEFSIYYKEVSSEEQKKTNNFNFPIRLGKPSEEIPNPYTTYAGGVPIDRPDRFVGRTVLVDSILSQIETISSKGFVLYGQQRSGKTSSLKNVLSKLSKPILGVFTDIAKAGDSVNFAIMIKEPLRQALLKEIKNQNWFESSKEFDSFFPLNDLKESPVSSITKMLEYAQEKLKCEGWENPKIVLLIDEFTDIYDKIKKGTVSDGIMKQWKSVMESGIGFFVLAGQDTMPWFMNEFPNEFGTFKKERITYLSKEETKILACDWIAQPDGSSRYRGSAFDKLYYYTAGSPYYTQKFCCLLVTHLNRRNAGVITASDIDSVCRQLCIRSENEDTQISEDEFHPLYKPLSAEYTSEDYKKVLRFIATESKNGKTLVNQIRIPGLTDVQVKDILQELKKRDILKFEDNDTDVRIYVGLFTEWLLANK